MFKNHLETLSLVALLSNNKQILFASYDKARCWDRMTGTVLQTFEGQLSFGNQWRFRLIIQKIISPINKTIWLWDVKIAQFLSTEYFSSRAILVHRTAQESLGTLTGENYTASRTSQLQFLTDLFKV